MSYKKMLIVHPVHDPISALDPALDVARNHDAQVDVLVLNLAGVPAIAVVQNPQFNWSKTFSDLLLETEKREKEVTAYLNDALLPYSVSAECGPLSMIDDLVEKFALCTDVVIFTNGESSFVSGLIGQAMEGALLKAGKPVLILAGAREQDSQQAPQKIFIAWDEVPQAARAVQAAIPVLQQAGVVDVLIVRENDAETEAVESASELITWLACHDVTATVSTINRDGQFVSHALANYIDSHPCDLLIMGAYGHSRISERLFSGTTHIALTDMDVPLLLSH